MSKEEYIRIIKEIEALPTGGITYKKINGMLIINGERVVSSARKELRMMN